MMLKIHHMNTLHFKMYLNRNQLQYFKLYCIFDHKSSLEHKRLNKKYT